MSLRGEDMKQFERRGSSLSHASYVCLYCECMEKAPDRWIHHFQGFNTCGPTLGKCGFTVGLHSVEQQNMEFKHNTVLCIGGKLFLEKMVELLTSCFYLLPASTNGNSSGDQYKFVPVTFYIFDPYFVSSRKLLYILI